MSTVQVEQTIYIITCLSFHAKQVKNHHPDHQFCNGTVIHMQKHARGGKESQPWRKWGVAYQEVHLSEEGLIDWDTLCAAVTPSKLPVWHILAQAQLLQAAARCRSS